MLFCELVPVISVHVKTENRHGDENEVCNQYAHPILNTMCLQIKEFSYNNNNNNNNKKNKKKKKKKKKKNRTVNIIGKYCTFY
jgi:hypothetical protein